MAKQKKQKLTAEQKKARREEARIKMKQDIKAHPVLFSAYVILRALAVSYTHLLA